MTNQELQVIQNIIQHGEEDNIEFHGRNQIFFADLNSSYYSVATAIGLCWTHHARFEPDFIEYAAAYIDGQIQRNFTISNTFQGRFGPELLDDALTNFRVFYRNVRHRMPDFNNCSVQDINVLQQRLLNQLNELRNNRQVTGIAAWLFLGPFKIILLDQRRLWDNNGINAIVLPMGFEVENGIQRLQSEGYSFINDFNLRWLQLAEGEGSLLDNYATCHMAHNFTVRIAELAGSLALHLNTGLHRYGRNDF